MIATYPLKGCLLSTNRVKMECRGTGPHEGSMVSMKENQLGIHIMIACTHGRWASINQESIWLARDKGGNHDKKEGGFSEWEIVGKEAADPSKSPPSS